MFNSDLLHQTVSSLHGLSHVSVMIQISVLVSCRYSDSSFSLLLMDWAFSSENEKILSVLCKAFVGLSFHLPKGYCT